LFIKNIFQLAVRDIECGRHRLDTTLIGSSSYAEITPFTPTSTPGIFNFPIFGAEA